MNTGQMTLFSFILIITCYVPCTFPCVLYQQERRSPIFQARETEALECEKSETGRARTQLQACRSDPCQASEFIAVPHMLTSRPLSPRRCSFMLCFQGTALKKALKLVSPLFQFQLPVSSPPFLPFRRQQIPRLLSLSSGGAPPSPHPAQEVWSKQSC